jgi:hypothetical protein
MRFRVGRSRRGFAAMLGRARIGIGNFMADTWRAVPSKARCDWGRLIPGNDRLIGDVDEPDGTAQCSSSVWSARGRIVRARDLEGLSGAAAVRLVAGSG